MTINQLYGYFGAFLLYRWPRNRIMRQHYREWLYNGVMPHDRYGDVRAAFLSYLNFVAWPLCGTQRVMTWFDYYAVRRGD